MENPRLACGGAEFSGQLTAAKSELLTLARKLDAGAYPDLAAQVGGGVVGAFWHARTEALGSGWVLALPLGGAVPDTSGFPSEMLQAVQRVGTLAAGLDALEATFLVGSVYSELMETSCRAELGAFHTPPALVTHLLDMVERSGFQWGEGSVLDPACGCGMFPVAVAHRMRAARPDLPAGAFIETLPAVLAGVELDPVSAWIAHVMLEAALLPECKAAGVRLPSLVRTADALELPQVATYDLVVGNPPYGKVRLDAARRRQYERSLFGHANLYGLFIDQGVHLLREQGLLAYVVPTSFLGGQYFKALRSVLAAHCPPIATCFVENRDNVFEDVLQETMLVVFKRREVAPASKLALVRLETLDEPDTSDASGKTVQYGFTGGEGPWLLPRREAECAFTLALSRMPGRLADYGYGVSTGPLVWNRHKAQLAWEPSTDAYPLVWAESVKAEGFALSAQKKSHAPWIRLRQGQGHLLTTQECLVLQRTTAKEQSRRLMAGILPSALLERYAGVVIENHLNVIVSQGPSPVSLEVLCMLLSSLGVDRAFRCISGSVAVSAYELESLPLPALSDVLRLQEEFSQHRSQVRFHQQVDALYAGAEVSLC